MDGMQSMVVPVAYVEYTEGLGMAVLHQGKRPPSGNIVGGSNGSWVTADSSSQSKINLAVEVQGQLIEIPVKWELKQVTGWQKISKKRAEKIQRVYPQNAEIFYDNENGFWRISSATMEEWARMLK